MEGVTLVDVPAPPKVQRPNSVRSGAFVDVAPYGKDGGRLTGQQCFDSSSAQRKDDYGIYALTLKVKEGATGPHLSRSGFAVILGVAVIDIGLEAIAIQVYAHGGKVLG